MLEDWQRDRTHANITVNDNRHLAAPVHGWKISQGNSVHAFGWHVLPLLTQHQLLRLAIGILAEAHFRIDFIREESRLAHRQHGQLGETRHLGEDGRVATNIQAGLVTAIQQARH